MNASNRGTDARHENTLTVFCSSFNSTRVKILYAPTLVAAGPSERDATDALGRADEREIHGHVSREGARVTCKYKTRETLSANTRATNCVGL